MALEEVYSLFEVLTHSLGIYKRKEKWQLVDLTCYAVHTQDTEHTLPKDTPT